jgi:hypothetical protein
VVDGPVDHGGNDVVAEDFAPADEELLPVTTSAGV